MIRVASTMAAIARRWHVLILSLFVVLLTAIPSATQTQPPTLVYDRPIDDAYRLRVTVVYTPIRPSVCCSSHVRVQLVDRRDASRYWEISRIDDEYEILFEVERADGRSVVLSRKTPDYGVDEGRIKLFFDARSKRLLKRIDFETSHDIEFPDDVTAQRVLGVSRAGLMQLRARRAFAGSFDAYGLVLPPPLVAHPLPQSSYKEFARARPQRVRDGYTESESGIAERVGAYQVVGDRVWFGKAYYDGEGVTGVGGIGYLNTAGSYTMLPIRALVDWSVLGFLVEPDTLWAARVRYPEGATVSGGLLQYARKTGRTRVHAIPDPIHSITHVNGGVFLGTAHGLYVIRDGVTTRYRAEPNIDGQFIVMSDRR